MSGPQGPYVWVVGDDSKAQMRPVQIGRGLGNNVIVTDGLQAGDRYIVEGVLKVFQPGISGERRDGRGGGPQAAGRAAAARRLHDLEVLHHAADLRLRHLGVHRDRRARRHARAADLRLSGHRAADGRRWPRAIRARPPRPSRKPSRRRWSRRSTASRTCCTCSPSTRATVTLTMNITFAIGSDPDLAAINVNNRIQAAVPRLPEEVRRQGIVVRKASTSILQVVAMHFAGRQPGSAGADQLRVAEHPRRDPARAGRRRRADVGPGVLDPHLDAARQAGAARPRRRRT